MLVLSRKVGESIVIGGAVVVTVVRVQDGKIHLGIRAPREIVVDREEIHEARQADARRMGSLRLAEGPGGPADEWTYDHVGRSSVPVTPSVPRQTPIRPPGLPS
jgi:carbon storage regulator CsrA